MSKHTWVILGATSIIAKEFAHYAAKSGHNLVLVGRDEAQLKLIASDIVLRYHVHCDVIKTDFSKSVGPLLLILQHLKNVSLLVAHSVLLNNDALTPESITDLVTVNITNTVQIIHTYWLKKQKEHQILFLSSVAACKGRAKNSLYGASKTAIERYLEGLQQASSNHQHITIARLGFIDTHATYGEPGIFYASPPKTCAKACWKAVMTQKRTIYHPFFWRYIMAIMTHLPFFIYKKMSKF